MIFFILIKWSLICVDGILVHINAQVNESKHLRQFSKESIFNLVCLS